MKIDELIEQLERYEAECRESEWYPHAEAFCKAAEVIKLLWEVARENRLAQYKMQIDEMRGEDGTADKAN